MTNESETKDTRDTPRFEPGSDRRSACAPGCPYYGAPAWSAAEDTTARDLLEHVMADTPSAADVEWIGSQLGRYPRGLMAIGARCAGCGRPLVTITRPLLEGGIPFPTTFYLCSGAAIKAASHLEAEGRMPLYAARVGAGAHDADLNPATQNLNAAYERAYRLYLAFRHALAEQLGDSEEHIARIAAGGLPTRVKCLHAQIAQSLVMGRGANPVGDMALDDMHADFDPAVCRCDATAARLGRR